MDDNNYVKILFRFHSNILDEITVETMWATVVDKERGLYQIDNIPFYVQSIASGDVVFAEFDTDEGMLTFRETVEYSGSSTIHVVLMDKSYDLNSIREIFEEMNCGSEKLNDGYFAMEIPDNVDYKPIKQKLSELQTQEIIGYAESCLSENHQY